MGDKKLQTANVVLSYFCDFFFWVFLRVLVWGHLINKSALLSVQILAISVFFL